MTKEAAIEILKDLWTYLQTDIRQALEMAIKTLEQESSGDLISLETVIEWRGRMKEDNKSLCEYGQDCVKAGYEKALQKINKIRTEIIEEGRKNTNMEYDKIFELCILIIDKYKAESEEV